MLLLIQLGCSRPSAGPSSRCCAADDVNRSSWHVKKQQRPQRCRSAAAAGNGGGVLPTSIAAPSGSGSSSASEARQVLDQFWLARGVVDDQQRRQLVEAAVGATAPGGGGSAATDAAIDELGELQQLPSLSAAWFMDAEGAGAPPQVAAASRRILALRQLLGGGDVDVVWMLVREPRLLSADFRSITQRLFDMKLAEGCEVLDVLRLVEQQPALLLEQGDGGGGGAAGSSSSDDETAEQKLQAWQHGLVSDGATEWARRHGELQQYVERHGDAHVGFRDGDDAELGRWAAKQRSEHRGGQLAEARRELLQAAGFEFDGERAEWLRWFGEVRAFRAQHGHCQPHPLANPNDFLLINWCSLQRIMRRSGVLLPDRDALLTSLGFDWSGADPLS